MKHGKFLILLAIAIFSKVAFSQTSSYGPGKSAPMPGMKSKYTYPQPAKRAATGPERFDPAFEVPDSPEKYVWKLTTKKAAANTKTQDVPVVYFGETETPSAVGSAREGEEISLDEFRVVGRRNFYKINWKGAPNTKVIVGSAPEYFVDGMYIQFAGKK